MNDEHGSYVELELLDGKRTVMNKECWKKMYDICEKTCIRLKFKSSFPFVEFYKRRYCTFKLRTQYEYLNSWLDDRFNVNCSAMQLAALFGVKARQFETACIESDLD